MLIARRYFENKTKRKARLGHSVINLFVNDWAQWKRLIVLLTDGP